MLTDLKPGWGSADLDRAQQGGSASGCRLQVLIESVSLPSLEGQAEGAAASLDMLLSWWDRGARESKTEQTKTSQDSHVLSANFPLAKTSHVAKAKVKGWKTVYPPWVRGKDVDV